MTTLSQPLALLAHPSVCTSAPPHPLSGVRQEQTPRQDSRSAPGSFLLSWVPSGLPSFLPVPPFSYSPIFTHWSYEADGGVSSLRGAGTGGLGLAIEGPSEAKMSCKDNKDGSCTVEYIPFTPGDYDVNITFGGRPIPGVQREWSGPQGRQGRMQDAHPIRGKLEGS